MKVSRNRYYNAAEMYDALPYANRERAKKAPAPEKAVIDPVSGIDRAGVHCRLCSPHPFRKLLPLRGQQPSRYLRRQPQELF